MRATETEMMAAHGPSRMAMRVAPVAWPVVPPIMGMLNIIMTKLNAAPMARYGACFAFRVLFSFHDANAQNGTTAAYITPYVAGPKYPSGMCIDELPPCRSHGDTVLSERLCGLCFKCFFKPVLSPSSSWSACRALPPLYRSAGPRFS